MLSCNGLVKNVGNEGPVAGDARLGNMLIGYDRIVLEVTHIFSREDALLVSVVLRPVPKGQLFCVDRC